MSPTTCQNCGQLNLNRYFLRYLDHYGSDFSQLDNYFQGISEENEANACSCHSCSAKECFTKILAKDKYCAKHAVSSSNSPCRCEGTDWLGRKKEYFCKFTVVTSDGYCRYHENQCAECSQRVASGEKYCAQHSNSYCQVIGCYERTPNSKDTNTYIYCKEHAKLHGNSLSNYQQAQEQQRISEQEKATEQTKLKSLVKTNTSIAGEIAEVERFSTDWNKNCAMIINHHNGYYWVFFGIIDRNPSSTGQVKNGEIFVFPTNANYEGNYGNYKMKRERHIYLTDAQTEAASLRNGLLSSSNPILKVLVDADSYTHINNLVSYPYIEKKNIPLKTETYTYENEYLVSYRTGDYAGGGYSYERYTAEGKKQVYPTNPREHFKPLDIVWIKRIATIRVGIEYYHVGVYLGNWNGDDWMCHLDGDNKGAEIITWKDFVKEDKDRDCPWELIRLYPIIPFKNYKDIAEQIGWAANCHWRRNNYCLASQNCEHFANMLVLGIDLSKQVYLKPTCSVIACPRLLHSGCVANNDKGSTINPSQEIRTTNNLLGKLNNQQAQNIKTQFEAKIMAPIKIGDCVIM